MYSVCAAVNDVEVIKSPLDVKNGRFLPKTEEIISILSGPNAARIKLLFLTSPGNPTGTCIPNDLVRTILDHPTWRGLVILDEAYIDFTEKTSAVALFDEGYQNLVVMQTLSKGFGLAGIRMGISFQSPELAQILANTKAPYSIGTPTATVALRALSKEVGFTLEYALPCPADCFTTESAVDEANSKFASGEPHVAGRGAGERVP